MKHFYCNAIKAICDCSILCADCVAHDNTGGHWVDVKTNADRIRAMTDEELAKFIPDWSYTNACKCDEKPYVDCNNECWKCVTEWLRQPVEV